MKELCDSYGVEMRVISAGRPMANGQAESAVKKLKTKLKSLCLENSEKFDTSWDGTVLQNALQILRTDPSSATGFSPAELILGRKLVYPFEIENMDIDFSGNLFFYFMKLYSSFIQVFLFVRRGIYNAYDSKIEADSR